MTQIKKKYILIRQECSHGRINETRDRLRKRLNQSHGKSLNKNQLLKNIKKDSSFNVTDMLGDTDNVRTTTTTTKTMSEQKENNANETREENLKSRIGMESGKFLHITLNKNNLNASEQQQQQKPHFDENSDSFMKNKGAVKKRKLLNAVNQQCTNIYESKQNPPVTTEPTKAQKFPINQIPTETIARVRAASFCPAYPNETASLDDIIDFIEGNSTSKKDVSKKAAKKAKQKQKKEDTKKMEELESLRDEFHELYFKEFDAKNDLKAVKSVKKRDKKKIADMENNVKKYGKSKAKIESSILELIGCLKKNSSEFKFAYLPTKEQQIEWQQKHSASQTNSQVPETKNEPIADNNRSNAQVLMTDLNAQQQSCMFTLDTSKQMVTIRRINVPHSEPQVTVTAKGPSPDKDKLLYTFINGQLIAGVSGANESQQTQQVPAKINEKKSKKEQKPVVSSECKNAKGKKNKSNTNIPTQPQIVEPFSNTNNAKKPNEKIKEKGNSRKSSVEEVKPIAKKQTNVLKSNLNTNTVQPKESDKKNTNKNKRSTPIADEVIELLTTATKQISLTDKKPKKEKKKVKVAKIEYADPNYKINKFDLLDMDEEDEYITESSSDECDDTAPVQPLQPIQIVSKPKSNKAAKTPQQQSQQIISVQNTQKIAKPAATIATQNSKNEKNKQTNLSTKPSKTNLNQKKTTQNATNIQNVKNTNLKILPKAEAIVLNRKEEVNPTPVAAEVTLTKKQKKKLAQKQVEKAVNVENLTKTLTDKMQRLQLNSDTTIELINDHHNMNGQMNSSDSMMDQLSRGVKVEGLTLPPGITLTRVDPRTVDATRAKKESIEKITYPAPQQYQQPLEYQRPSPFMSINGPMMNQMPNSSGYIMVEPTKKQQPSVAAGPAETISTSKKKRNKKKNKNKTETNTNANPIPNQTEPKIVTLRNPFFHQNDTSDGMRSQMPSDRASSQTNNGNQLASITKNENGIYTIRNTAFQNALSNGMPSPYRYSTDVYPKQTSKPDNFSYFTSNTNDAPNKSTQAIGSEIRNANQVKNKPWYPINNQQQQQQQHSHHRQQQQTTRQSPNNDLFGNMSHLSSRRPYSPFDSNTNYGFNSDFIGASQTPYSQAPPTTTISSQNSYYNGAFSATVTSGADSLFSRSSSTCDNSRHCCDDSPPTHESNSYFGNNHGYGYKNYEDSLFLQGLHPGKRLNSEVNYNLIFNSHACYLHFQ